MPGLHGGPDSTPRSFLRRPGGQRAGMSALLDRTAERAAIDNVLAAARGGLSSTLVLRGGPGVGKTTLLQYSVAAASDFTVSTVSGVESEISLDFGALHGLLTPFLSRLDELPPPQRSALRIAFGQEAGPPPERFLVGLATLTLLSQAAREKPVLCVIDDANWLDPESAQVLSFVARRLYAECVGLIAAIHELSDQPVFEYLPTITVGGLPDAEALELLSSVAGIAINSAAVDRILADTHNNPLALVELGTEYTAGQLSGRAALPEPLPLGQRLREHFLRQVRSMSPNAQAFALLAAADPEGDREQLWEAAARAGVDPAAAAAEAAQRGLLEFPGNSVQFRYPLLRSAVYHGASDTERRNAHHALSQAGSEQLRAWHLAAATLIPDEALATDLQRTAERAGARGGYAARAALLRRAVDLTPDDARRAEREMALAEARLMAGDSTAAQSLVDVALPRLTSVTSRAEAVRLEGEIRFAQGDAAGSARILAKASTALAHDDRAARDTMLGAFEAAIWSGPVLTREIARQARAFPRVTGAPTVSDLLLEGYTARFTLGYETSVQPLRAATAALRADDADPVVALRWSGLVAAAAMGLYDEEGATDVAQRWVNLAQATGAFTILPVTLAFLGFALCQEGRLREADSQWAMMLDLMTATHGPAVLGLDSRTNGVLLAYRGDFAGARASGRAQTRESAERGQGGPADLGRYITSVADLFSGDYAAAVSNASIVVENDPATTAEMALPELIEAAVRLGRREVADSAYETLSQRALAVGTPWAMGLRARSAALLAEDSRAEDYYLEAISQLGNSRIRPQLARAHLLYGQWLRRMKRRRDARLQLRTAHDLFAGMGADWHAKQAAAELLATGEHARARGPEAITDFTPQEARIAELVTTGASNGEIAAQLFISPSTVDHHLRKVYRKVNVTSRAQLAARMRSEAVGAGRVSG
jgi:DNA-binding CsgD family transcriptional regulator